MYQTPFLAAGCPGLNPRDRRNLRFTEIGMSLFALSYAAGVYLVTNDMLNSWLAVLVAFLPSTFALLTAIGFARFLRYADELQRDIQLKALSLAAMAGFVMWPATFLFGPNGLDVESLGEYTPIVMLVAYGIGIYRARRYYQ